MNIILFDDFRRIDLLPLTYTRPVCEIRIGILTIREKWEKSLGQKISYLSEPYLSKKFPIRTENDNLLINGGLLPDKVLVEKILNLNSGTSIIKHGVLLAARTSRDSFNTIKSEDYIKNDSIEYENNIFLLEQNWQVFTWNGREIQSDYNILTNGRKTFVLSPTNNLINPENIFVEEGVKAEYTTINASSGPVYLSKNSEIMEGSTIRGPFALGEESVVKMQAKIYGPTTIGPFCKVGGEINNSVFMSHSNKAHDGFLGNSVIGEWCNLGADTNNSNLKNNYAEVRLWSFRHEKFISTGLQFCGLIMGDHSKCGINTMFNTGTIIGVNANIFGSGFPRNFIPSFSWGGAHGMSVYSIPKAFEVAEKVMLRRGIIFDDIEKEILKEVFTQSEKYRR
jgi:UDP-N-acetylglucosamine diphosphorylase/glucosamine-1-phosphate N-acetyltransferase